jgi:anti-sigma regulatory factor (Ser/Thr protein kinase)
VPTDGGARPARSSGGDAWAGWEHVHRLEFVLHNARDLDTVARGALIHLAGLPDVTRVGLALTEGAGRRLRFIASDSVAEAELPWCHIDAYDDVPLTAVTRSGQPVVGNLDQLEGRFPGVVAHQREAGTRALAAMPLPGVGPPMGGLIVFFDADQSFTETQRRVLDAAARRTAEAVRRVRADALGTGPTLAGPALGDGHRAERELDGEPRSAGAARRFLRERLAEWGFEDDAVDTAQLCLSELVNNVIMHAHATAELTVHVQETRLSVIVRDRGGALPGAAPHPDSGEDPMRVFGRGLTLVDALAERWGTERDDVGTTAWFVLDLAAPEGSERTG